MALDFQDVIDAAPGVEVVSDPLVISGLSLGTKAISIVGAGELRINGGAWVTSGVVQNGDSVYLRLTTPAGQNGQVTERTVNLQTYGYINWTVTNINSVLDEFGTGVDALASVLVVAGDYPQELLSGVEELTPASYVPVDEVGALVDTFLPFYILTFVFDEAGSGADVPFAVNTQDVDEAGAGAELLLPAAGLVLSEAGASVDALTPNALATHLVADVFSGADSVVTALTWLVEEAGLSADTLLTWARVAELVNEYGAGAAEDISAVLGALVVDEAGVFGDYSFTVASLTAYLNGGTMVGADFPIYQSKAGLAWVANSRSLALSRWLDHGVTQFHQVDGVVYGVAEDGLYVVDAAAPVDAAISTGLYDFGRAEVKFMDMGYLSYTSAGPLEVDAVASSGGAKTVTTYRQPAYESDTPRQTRVRFGRGRSARWWGFTIRNTDGLAVTVQDLRVLPLVGSRRI